MLRRSTLSWLAVSFLMILQVNGQGIGNPGYDLSRTPVLYTVGYAHLDTQWRWDYEETVNDFLKATLDENFYLFNKYPDYVFTFSGARRYRMMKEYYPDRFRELKKWIIRDRWFVGGSSVDECDPNVPSPESIIRQVLYGNRYFRSEFGKESVDFLLPDCFGFQAHFPSVLNHCGLKGFSTQKLSWGSANGIPFSLGNWIGPDNKGIVSALNATSYNGGIQERLDTSSYWTNRVLDNGRKYGVYADYRYYGVGDVGGAPREEDVIQAEGSLNHPDSRIQVYLSSSDQLFRDLTPEEAAKLPSYTGDLLLTEHSSGSITSQAYMKRWNRKNELLAQAAEPLAVMADRLRAIPYPKERLNETWWLALGSQMHDILPGTALPSAYGYAWNDEVLAMNLFSSVLESSAGAVMAAMETTAEGIPLVVYNPLSVEREDVVEATLDYPDGAPENIRVFDPEGSEVLSQVTSRTKTTVQLLFLAHVPSTGLACYDVRPSREPSLLSEGIRAGRLSMENQYYRLLLGTDGDIHSILDKQLDRELLSGNMSLVFLKEHPRYWPAWNMDWNNRKTPPVGAVEGPATTTLVEKGPVRVTYKVERESRHSRFTQWIRLTAGESGARIMVDNQVAWQSKGVSLKASFPLTAANDKATYNLGYGTIERPVNHPKKYEVPSREWFDLTDRSGDFGVTILEDCKFGSDLPNDSTLRLTLLYTPTSNEYHDQATQDWGIHDFTYGLYGHAGDWRTGLSEWQGRAVNQPLIAFRAAPHPGFLGKTLSIASLDTAQVGIRAMKLGEEGKEIIIRVQELFGKAIDYVTLTMPGKIIAASEVDGQEQFLQMLSPEKGMLRFALGPYEMKSFSLSLEPATDTLTPPASSPLTLLFDEDVLTQDSSRYAVHFGSSGISIPAELFPGEVSADGIPFVLGGSAPGQMNAMACNGQRIDLPKTGQFNRLYFLASAEEDTTVTFRTGHSKENLRIQGFSGDIGQFDNRIWDQHGQVSRIDPGFIKRDEVAWFSTHLHNDSANIPYRYAYLFKYALDVTPSTGWIQLPEDPSVKLFAMTLAYDSFDAIEPVQPLYDDFTGRETMPLIRDHYYVTEGMAPLATVETSREKTVEQLPVKVTTKDYASVWMPNGVTVTYIETESGDPDRTAWTPLPISVINDGMFDLMPADSARDIWFEEGEGRMMIDLQKAIEIDSLHIFSSLDLERGAQAFSIWGFPDRPNPSFTGNPPDAGWTFIVMCQPIELWGGGKAVYQIRMDRPVTFRYMMFVSQSGGHGPIYFREVDLFEKQK